MTEEARWAVRKRLLARRSLRAMAILLAALDADTQEALEIAVRAAADTLSGSSDSRLRAGRPSPAPPSAPLHTPPGGVPPSLSPPDTL